MLIVFSKALGIFIFGNNIFSITCHIVTICPAAGFKMVLTGAKGKVFCHPQRQQYTV